MVHVNQTQNKKNMSKGCCPIGLSKKRIKLDRKEKQT